MPKQAPISTTSRITLAAPDACEVFIAGSFNDWSTTANPMTRDDQGWWETELALPPGRYEYKFVVDGQWCCEAGCDRPNVGSEGCTPNPFGTLNRVLDVPEHGR